MNICVKCGKSEGEVHPIGKLNDPYFVGICCACGGDVYRPMTTAVIYFSEFDLYNCKKKPEKLVPLLERAIEDLYACYQNVRWAVMPGTTTYCITTATHQELYEFFES